MNPDLTGIAHVIQLAVAPVFLLAGIGGFLGVLTSRLARVVDRFRALQDAAGATDEAHAPELRTLLHRARWIHRAISLCTTSALLVSIVIAVLFIGSISAFATTGAISVLFVLAMLALILGLLCFLREVFLATGVISLRRD